MKKIVLAIDSFKGSLSSAEAERAAEAGIKAVFPACEVVSIPVADGGEGMLDAWLPVSRVDKLNQGSRTGLIQETSQED